MSDAGRQGAGGDERRRRTWSADQKQRIIEESFARGASVADVARRYGLNSNLLFTWRRRGQAASGAGEPVNIVPVRIVTDAAPASPAVASSPVGRIEIVLVSGERIIVGPDVDATALGRIIKALTRPGRAGLA
jgi:transposase